MMNRSMLARDIPSASALPEHTIYSQHIRMHCACILLIAIIKKKQCWHQLTQNNSVLSLHFFAINTAISQTLLSTYW